MDAIGLLKEDHKTVAGLFAQFEMAKGTLKPAAKRNLVDEILTALTTHAYIEETIFYPAAAKAVPETNDHVLESIEEHHVVAWLLSELQHRDPKAATLDAKVTVLIENVRHHVEEEEKEWFPQVRKALSRTELGEIGDRMAAATKDAPADPMKLASAKA